MSGNGAQRSRTKGKPSWQEQVSRLIAAGRITAALSTLDRIIINRQMELFRSSRSIDTDRRLAWLRRIELLRSLGRIHEALAWTLLECELSPRSRTAKALKEQLVRELQSADGDRGGRSTKGSSGSGADDRWAGVAGMRDLKATLERDVILPFQEPELYRQYKVSLPSGILLYGPPGCGKTLIARRLGVILGLEYIEVRSSDLGSRYIHEAEKNIAALFARACEVAPALLFFDELDALLPVRTETLHHSYASEVNELLMHLNECGRHRVLVVGATNRMDMIDPAALRPGRFDKKVHVGPPDFEARAELIRIHLRDRPHDAIDVMRIASESAGYTGAEIEHIAAEAARRALEKRRPICAEDFMAEFARNPAMLESAAHPRDGPTAVD